MARFCRGQSEVLQKQNTFRTDIQRNADINHLKSFIRPNFLCNWGHFGKNIHCKILTLVVLRGVEVFKLGM